MQLTGIAGGLRACAVSPVGCDSRTMAASVRHEGSLATLKAGAATWEGGSTECT